MKEYKIKWEIELDANSPEEAVVMALEMIQSKDSHAKVFNVDGVNIDAEDVAKDIEKERYWNMRANEIVGDSTIKFGRAAFLQFSNKEHIVTVWKDEARFKMEVVEDFEVARGNFRELWYTLDDISMI